MIILLSNIAKAHCSSSQSNRPEQAKLDFVSLIARLSLVVCNYRCCYHSVASLVNLPNTTIAPAITTYL
jgi:hypothetical protein